MADNSEIIELHGKLVLDSDSTNQEIQKIIQSFKKLENSPISKLQKDFQSITAVVKGLDKELAKTIQTFSKNSARENIGKINSALKDQVDILKRSTAEVQNFSKALKGVNPNSKEYQELFQKLQNAQRLASGAVAGIVQGGQERSYNQQILNSRAATMVSGAGRATELAGMAADFGIKQWGESAFRNNIYRSQYASPGQSLATQMAFDPISAALFAQQGGPRQMREGLDYGRKEAETRPILGSAFRVGAAGLSGAAAGAGIGALGGSILPGLGTLAGGGGGALAGGAMGFIGQIIKEATGGGDNLGLSGEMQRQSAVKATQGGALQQVLSSGQTNVEFLSALAHEALEKAPGRMAVGESFAGAGGFRSGMRSLRLGANSGIGMSQAELTPISQLFGATGISSQQRSPEQLKSFLLAQRAGLGNAQELIAGGGQFLGVSAQPGSTKAMQEFSNAVKDGILSGFKNPQIAKTFASAAMELASASKGRLNDTQFYQSQLLGALGGKDTKDVTQRDLANAKSAIEQANFFTGGGTVRSLATNLYNVGDAGKKLSIADQMYLAQMTNPDELLADKSSAAHKHFLGVMGGDEGALRKLVEPQVKKNISGKFADLAFGTGNMDFAELANVNKMDAFTRGMDKNDPETMKKFNSMSVALGVLERSKGLKRTDSEIEQEMRAMMGYTLDPTTKGKLPNISKGTQELGLGATYAGAEATRDAERGGPNIAKAIREAIEMSGKMQKNALDNPDTMFNKNLGDMTAATIGILNILEKQFGTTVNLSSGSETYMSQELNMIKGNMNIIPPTKGSGTISPNKK